MTEPHRDNRRLALACVLGAVGVAASQDAITKSMSGEYSAYETVIFRCVGSFPVLLALLWSKLGPGALMTPLWRTVLLRSCVLCSAYFAFVLSIAAMPIANAVAIYFTMPFFVASLAGPILGETVRIHRWLAIIAGFILYMQYSRPGRAMRALAQDRVAAQLMGVEVDRYTMIGFAMGAMLAGVVGGLLVTITGVNSGIGGPISIKAFTMVMIGGAGVTGGAIAGGFILGMLESVGLATLREYGDITYLVIFAALMVFLAVRPNGLMGKPWG